MAYALPCLPTRLTDGNNRALAGAKMHVFEAGTTTPADFYTTNDLDVAHTNPLVADSGGLFGEAFFAPGAYKIRFTSSADATIYEIDDFTVGAAGSQFTYPLATKTANFTVGADDVGKVFLCDASGIGGLNLIVTANSDTLGQGFPFIIINTGATGKITIQGVSAQTVDGSANLEIETQNAAASFVSKGAAGWQTTSKSGVGATNATALGVTSTSAFITPANLGAFHGKGSDIASASTITIGNGGYFDVTGTTQITGVTITNDFAGRAFRLKFEAATPLQNGASFILKGGEDFTTVAGDTADFVSEGGGVVRMTAYNQASLPLLGNGWNVFSYEALTVGSTEYNVTGLGNATHVRLTFLGIELSTPRNIWVRTSSDGGSTYDSTSGNYKNNNVNATHILIGTTTGLTVYGVSTFYDFGTASKMAVRHDIQELAATNTAAATTVSTCELTAARDALRVLLNSTGTFQAGAIMVETWTP